MGLEEAIEFVARLEAEQAAQFRAGDAARLVLFEAKPFQSAPRQVLAVRSQAAGKVVGDGNGQVRGSAPSIVAGPILLRF